MARKILNKYIILFCDEWHIPEPAYYWIDSVKGKNPKDAIKRNLPHLLRVVRRILMLAKTEVADYKLERSLYVVLADHWLSANAAYWQADLANPRATLEIL